MVSADSHLGNYTYVGFNCYITKAKIGRYTSIANNVCIGQGEHNYKDITTSTSFCESPYEKLTAGDCIIGNDVWICAGATIRRNVRIGNGVVVGANSFVNRDVPDFAIVVGSPAKIIKYRFEENIIKEIKASKWWDFEINDAREIIQTLRDSINQKSS